MMASSLVKIFSKSLLNAKYTYSPSVVIKRHSSKLKPQKRRPGTIRHRNLIASSSESLAPRGFLRSYKPYTPPENVKEIVLEYCKNILGTNFNLNSELSRENKFALLNTCFVKLNHSVPNSFLHKIVTAQDVVQFYETPVSTTVPYDELRNQELPPNLHIQYDYLRFDPETDTKFKGISAFPKSSTIVTGLKYKEKYKGHTVKLPYEDAEEYVRKNFLF